MPVNKKLLEQYVVTANSGKYKSWDEINSKFPEFKDVDAKLLEQYVVTANSGKYKSWDEINGKFPEFFATTPTTTTTTPTTKTPQQPAAQAKKPTIGTVTGGRQGQPANLNLFMPTPQVLAERKARDEKIAKAAPQAPKDFEQANLAQKLDKYPSYTAEEYAINKTPSVDEQPFSLSNMLKSRKQKEYELEQETLKKYVDASELVAKNKGKVFEANFGMPIEEAQRVESALQPYFAKANPITAELNKLVEEFNATVNIEDEAKRTATQAAIQAKAKVKVDELNGLKKTYAKDIATYDIFAEDPTFKEYKQYKDNSTKGKNQISNLVIDPRYKDVTQDIGEIEGLVNSYTRGMQNAEIADILAAGRQPTIEELRRIAKLKRDANAAPVSDAMKRFNDAQGFLQSAKAFIFDHVVKCVIIATATTWFCSRISACGGFIPIQRSLLCFVLTKRTYAQ